jgi:prepilin peptidase CpaA
LTVAVGEVLWGLLFTSWLLLIIWFDGIWRRVPNAWLLVALAVQIVFLAERSLFARNAAWPGASGWLDALSGFLLGLAFVAFWYGRVMGAGDVKFLAVLGAWTGVYPLIAILLMGSILAALHALFLLYAGERLRSRNVLPNSNRARSPYAACLAISALSLGLTHWSSLSCSWFSLYCSTASSLTG